MTSERKAKYLNLKMNKRHVPRRGVQVMTKKYVVDVPFSAKVRVTVVSDERIKDGELVSKILDDGRKSDAIRT